MSYDRLTAEEVRKKVKEGNQNLGTLEGCSMEEQKDERCDITAKIRAETSHTKRFMKTTEMKVQRTTNRLKLLSWFFRTLNKRDLT